MPWEESGEETILATVSLKMCLSSFLSHTGSCSVFVRRNPQTFSVANAPVKSTESLCPRPGLKRMGETLAGGVLVVVTH